MRKQEMLGAAVVALFGFAQAASAQMEAPNQSQPQQMQDMQKQNAQAVRRHEDKNASSPANGAGPMAPGTGPMGANDRAPSQRDMSGASTPAKGARPSRLLSSTQKSHLHQAVIDSNRSPRIAHVNFDLRVGTRIPRDVRVEVVPQEIVEIDSDWSGFLYFVAGDDIVVLDPNTYEVVAVLEA